MHASALRSSSAALTFGLAAILGGCPISPTALIAAGTGTGSIQGTWERTDHNSTIVVAADGTVLSERTLNCETPCDGQTHPCELGLQIGLAIEPYRLVVDTAGHVTMEGHEVREYLPGSSQALLTMRMSAEGRLSGNELTIETLKEPLGLRQQWTYTKVSD